MNDEQWIADLARLTENATTNLWDEVESLTVHDEIAALRDEIQQLRAELAVLQQARHSNRLTRLSHFDRVEALS